MKLDTKQQKFNFAHKGTYYNTNNESGKVLKASQKAVTGQERAVLVVFFMAGQQDYTPSEMAKKFKDKKGRLKYPLTSIRRAITNLTDAGRLVKTDEYRPGIYGKREHIWRRRG